MAASQEIRVALAGARGRMGRSIAPALREAPDLELVAEIERHDDLAAVLRRSEAGVLVDFTSPECGADHLEAALELGIHPVIGTTGLDRVRLDRALELSRRRRIGGVVAPNFALGAVLMIELARRAARHLPAIEIIEQHHPDKKDRPSGTALRTREVLAEVVGRGEIPIRSVRLPGVVANQEVILGADANKQGPQERALAEVKSSADLLLGNLLGFLKALDVGDRPSVRGSKQRCSAN